MASLKYFQRYYQFCDLSLMTSSIFKQKLKYIGNKRRSFEKESAILTHFYFIGTLTLIGVNDVCEINHT